MTELPTVFQQQVVELAGMVQTLPGGGRCPWMGPLCPEKQGSNPGQGSKGINFSGWHGLDMSITVTKRR